MLGRSLVWVRCSLSLLAALRAHFAKTGDPRGRKLVDKMVDVGHDVLRKNGKIPIVWEVSASIGGMARLA